MEKIDLENSLKNQFGHDLIGLKVDGLLLRCENGDFIATDEEITLSQMHRIVLCVNALEDIANPFEYIKMLKKDQQDLIKSRANILKANFIIFDYAKKCRENGTYYDPIFTDILNTMLGIEPWTENHK